jgi:L-lactate dehydrogenase
MNKTSKITVLGAGNVGATIAYTLVLEGLAAEVVLVDINKDKANGEAMDIVQGSAFYPSSKVIAGDYADTVDSDVVIVTVGSARKPGQSRIDLAQGNVRIIKSVMPQILKYAPDALYVVVSNPVDIITYTILKTTGLPENQVIGSGTLLDTARLRDNIAQSIGVSPKNIHSFVLGEHGDTSMIPWSLTAVGGIPMETYLASIRNKSENIHVPDKDAVLEDVHKAGGNVIRLKGATFYAIALVARRICEAIMRNGHSVLTCSTMMHGEYGVSDVCVSVPCIIGAGGIENIATPPMTAEEEAAFAASAASLKAIIAELDI